MRGERRKVEAVTAARLERDVALQRRQPPLAQVRIDFVEDGLARAERDVAFDAGVVAVEAADGERLQESARSAYDFIGELLLQLAEGMVRQRGLQLLGAHLVGFQIERAAGGREEHIGIPEKIDEAELTARDDAVRATGEPSFRILRDRPFAGGT